MVGAIATILAATLSAITAVVTTTQLTRRSRMRSRLAKDVGVYKDMEHSKARDLLGKAIERRAAMVAAYDLVLYSPTRRTRCISFLIVGEMFVGVFIFTRISGGGAPGLADALILIIAYVVHMWVFISDQRERSRLKEVRRKLQDEATAPLPTEADP